MVTLRQVWQLPATDEEQLVYDKLYMTDAWNEAQDEIQKQRHTDDCQLERVIAGIMLWSDSTQLAQFSHASAWLVYLFFGNLSKYARHTPNTPTCHPIAFIPPVSVRSLYIAYS